MEDNQEGRRKAMKDYTSHKVIFSIIGGFMLDILGGWDNLMAFLVMLVVADTISGVFKAIKTKTLSSEAMRVGLFKKAMIALIVAISVQADKVVLDYCGHPILLHFDGKNYEFSSSLIGRANIYNILAGIALSHELGMSISDIHITHLLHL